LFALTHQFLQQMIEGDELWVLGYACLAQRPLGEVDAIIQTGLAVAGHPVGLPQRLPALSLRAKASLVREESMDRTCCHWL
jgi:hypothetical protein